MKGEIDYKTDEHEVEVVEFANEDVHTKVATRTKIDHREQVQRDHIATQYMYLEQDLQHVGDNMFIKEEDMLKQIGDRTAKQMHK